MRTDATVHRPDCACKAKEFTFDIEQDAKYKVHHVCSDGEKVLIGSGIRIESEIPFDLRPQLGQIVEDALRKGEFYTHVPPGITGRFVREPQNDRLFLII